MALSFNALTYDVNMLHDKYDNTAKFSFRLKLYTNRAVLGEWMLEEKDKN